MLASRYLRAKRSEGGVGLITVISFAGVTLAVAILIIVMSVMNGFRAELLNKILGFNGHVFVTDGVLDGTARHAWRSGASREVPTASPRPSRGSRPRPSPWADNQIYSAIVEPFLGEFFWPPASSAAAITKGDLRGFGPGGEYGGDVVVVGDRLGRATRRQARRQRSP